MLRLQGVKNQSSLRRENLSYHEQVRENGACTRSDGCYWYGGTSLCGNDGCGNWSFVYVWDHFDLWNDRYRYDNRHNRRYDDSCADRNDNGHHDGDDDRHDYWPCNGYDNRD